MDTKHRQNTRDTRQWNNGQDNEQEKQWTKDLKDSRQRTQDRQFTHDNRQQINGHKTTDIRQRRWTQDKIYNTKNNGHKTTYIGQ